MGLLGEVLMSTVSAGSSCKVQARAVKRFERPRVVCAAVGKDPPFAWMMTRGGGRGVLLLSYRKESIW